jgi:hypothetical protein
MLSLMPRTIPDRLTPLAWKKREVVVDRRCRLAPTSSRVRLNTNKSPARWGRPGEALVSDRAGASKCAGARTVVQAD